MELPAAAKIAELGSGGDDRGEGEGVGWRTTGSHVGEEGKRLEGAARVEVGGEHRVPRDRVPLEHIVEQLASGRDPPGSRETDQP